MIAVRQSVPAVQESKRRFCDSGLLSVVHIFLRGRLDAFAAGLHLYKMYSILVKADDVNLQVSAAPVPLYYGVTQASKI